MNVGQPLSRNISMHIIPEHYRPLVSSMRAMVNNLTRAMGIFVGGHIIEGFSSNMPFAFTIFLYAMGTLMFLSFLEISSAADRDHS